MEEKKLFRMICKLILFGGAICLGVIYSKEVINVVKLFVAMLSPFLAGAAIAIEKGFQGGGDALRAKGIKVESLAIIESMQDGKIVYRN